MTIRTKTPRRVYHRAIALIIFVTLLTAGSTSIKADTGTCAGVTVTLPFTDVMGNIFFCNIASAFFSGLTNGTDATHYSPAASVTREQMPAFVTRTMDQTLKRGSRRAALNQYWTIQGANNLAITTVGNDPAECRFDGADLWVANSDNTVSRVRASDGKNLGTWFCASPFGVLCALGKVFVSGLANPGRLYQIDPAQPAPAVTTLSTTLGGQPCGLACDGQRIWSGNQFASVSIITLNPVTVTTVSTGFTFVRGILFDGANIWVTDNIAGSVDKLRKLDSNGAILQSVDVGNNPTVPVFDGTNIWVPNVDGDTVTVVRATGGLAGTAIATLSGNGLNKPFEAAFDGERILVTNLSGNSVSLWKATDLSPIGTFSMGAGTSPQGACSSPANFWITLIGTNKLARF